MTGQFDGRMLGVLESYSPARAEFELKRLPIRLLGAGMVLDKDVVSKDGKLLIMKAGTALTEIWIERLENFAKPGVDQQLVDVRLPRFVVHTLDEIGLGAPVNGKQKANGAYPWLKAT
jgi:hypothetical protein